MLKRLNVLHAGQVLLGPQLQAPLRSRHGPLPTALGRPWRAGRSAESAELAREACGPRICHPVALWQHERRLNLVLLLLLASLSHLSLVICLKAPL